MAKVLLVEDDNNLREIYEARLQAEGYETATASDGEQALVVAKEAKPDLVISDVMMPKISGFEMLDILRNTDGLKDVKVIMLTALGQSEDKSRADQLGADKYLVKSQVTLEDIVKTAHQLLDEGAAPAAPAAPAATTTDDAATTASAAPSASDQSATMKAQIDNFAAEPAPSVSEPAPEPATPAAAAPAAPAADAASAHDDEVMADAAQSLADASPATEKPSDVTAVEVPSEAAEPATPAAAAPAAGDDTDQDETEDADGVTIAHKKVIEPINDPAAAKPDLNQLLAAEEAKVAGSTVAPVGEPVETPDTTADESAAMQAQLDSATAAAEAPTPPKPAADAAPAAPTAPGTPANVTEPSADPKAPNPNDIAL
jgi:CheY-like chemotaxis protein